MNNKSSIEATIARKIVEADPALDIQGSDRKMLQIAQQDFVNYAKYAFALGDAETDGEEVTEKIAKIIDQDPVEADTFVGVWAGMWLGKWKQRVKLVLQNQNRPSAGEAQKAKQSENAASDELENEEEILNMIVSTLVRNAEICGTEIIAENLLKLELVKSKKLPLTKEERYFAVVNGALRHARELALSVSPMIFVKVDKGYFAAAAQ